MLVKSQSPGGARWRVPACAPSLTAHYRQIAARRAAEWRQAPRRLRRTPRGTRVVWRLSAVARGRRSARYHWLEVGALYALVGLAMMLGALGMVGLGLAQ